MKDFIIDLITETNNPISTALADKLLELCYNALSNDKKNELVVGLKEEIIKKTSVNEMFNMIHAKISSEEFRNLFPNENYRNSIISAINKTGEIVGNIIGSARSN